MPEKHKGPKLCPLPFIGGYFAAQCPRTECGWWDDQFDACAMVTLSQALRFLDEIRESPRGGRDSSGF